MLGGVGLFLWLGCNKSGRGSYKNTPHDQRVFYAMNNKIFFFTYWLSSRLSSSSSLVASRVHKTLKWVYDVPSLMVVMETTPSPWIKVFYLFSSLLYFFSKLIYRCGCAESDTPAKNSAITLHHWRFWTIKHSRDCTRVLWSDLEKYSSNWMVVWRVLWSWVSVQTLKTSRTACTRTHRTPLLLGVDC